MPRSDLTVIHKRRLDAVRAVASRGVLNAFDKVTAPTSEAVNGFIADTVPLILAAQTTTVDLVDAYLSAYSGTAPVGLDPAALIGAKARNGVVLETVYRRPFWQWERDGLQDAARARMSTDVLTDIQLVQRDATYVRMAIDPNLARWRRVTSGGSCDLCTSASTRTYKNIQQVAIHPGCDCTIEPVLTGTEGAPDPARLPEAYRSLQDSRLLAATAAGVAVHDHGELGPTLAVEGHEFT